MITKFRTKKVEIEGIKYTGNNIQELVDYAGGNKIAVHGNDVSVWNFLENQWINIPVGHWLLKGLRKEFYPCEEEALFMKYEII